MEGEGGGGTARCDASPPSAAAAPSSSSPSSSSSSSSPSSSLSHKQQTRTQPGVFATVKKGAAALDCRKVLNEMKWPIVPTRHQAPVSILALEAS